MVPSKIRVGPDSTEKYSIRHDPNCFSEIVQKNKFKYQNFDIISKSVSKNNKSIPICSKIITL